MNKVDGWMDEQGGWILTAMLSDTPADARVSNIECPRSPA